MISLIMRNDKKKLRPAGIQAPLTKKWIETIVGTTAWTTENIETTQGTTETTGIVAITGTVVITGIVAITATIATTGIITAVDWVAVGAGVDTTITIEVDAINCG